MAPGQGGNANGQGMWGLGNSFEERMQNPALMGMLGAGMGLLGASGPQQQPMGLGGILGQGLGGGMAGMMAAQQRKRDGMMDGLVGQYMQKHLGGDPSKPQPGGPAAAPPPAPGAMGSPPGAAPPPAPPPPQMNRAFLGGDRSTVDPLAYQSAGGAMPNPAAAPIPPVTQTELAPPPGVPGPIGGPPTAMPTFRPTPAGPGGAPGPMPPGIGPLGPNAAMFDDAGADSPTAMSFAEPTGPTPLTAQGWDMTRMAGNLAQDAMPPAMLPGGSVPGQLPPGPMPMSLAERMAMQRNGYGRGTGADWLAGLLGRSGGR